MSKDYKKDIAKVKRQLSKIEEIKITNEKEEKKYVNILYILKSRLKEIKEKKEKITSPIKKSLKEIDNLFNPLMDEIERKISLIENFLIEYKEREIKEKIQEKIKNISKSNIEEIVESINEVKEKIKNKDYTQFYRKITSFQIEDENLIPREYLTPDLIKIRRDILYGKQIPGVKKITRKVVIITKNYGQF